MCDKREIDSESMWQAYRYVADEMTSEERIAFEERLDLEQSAREAVAKMAEIAAAIRSLPVEAFIKPKRMPAIVHRAGWMALGVAASLLIMFGWRQFPAADGQTAGISDSAQDPQLALAWTPAEQDAEVPDESSTVSLSDSLSDTELAGDFSTPSWLAAALLADPENDTNKLDTEIN